MSLPKNLEIRANQALTELIDRKIVESGNESRSQYSRLLEERGILNARHSKAMITGQNPFNPNKLAFMITDLGICESDISPIFGRNQLTVPLEGIVSQPNPIGVLVEWYALLRTGQDLYVYLKTAKQRNITDRPISTLFGWLKSRGKNLPLFYLKRFVDDLAIPLGELTVVYGRNPFEPPIDDFKKGKNAIGELIKWYIGLRTGQTTTVYLNNAVKRGQINAVTTAISWLNGVHTLPLAYLRIFVDDLGISPEHLSQIYGKDPFKPPLEKFKTSSNSIGNLIDWYIDFRTGLSRDEYLLSVEKRAIGGTFYAMEGAIRGYSVIRLLLLKLFAEDLQIPTHDLTYLYGYNPFEPRLEDFKKSENPVGSLIDWYISFKKGCSRKRYLQIAQENGLIRHVGTSESWFIVEYGFPPNNLKLIVDDLQIPYSEVNQFIDYDIAQANQVAILRSNSATTPQSIGAAVSTIGIPTDPQSLAALVELFGDTPTAGVIGLVDVLYAVMPHQIAALERKKIGKQEVADYLKSHLASDSGTTAGSGNGNLPPFLTITRIVPFETYQRDATVRSHLVNIALTRYMRMPYGAALGQIDSQLTSNPNDRVLHNVLLETRAYLDGINRMPKSITRVGA